MKAEKFQGNREARQALALYSGSDGRHADVDFDAAALLLSAPTNLYSAQHPSNQLADARKRLGL